MRKGLQRFPASLTERQTKYLERKALENGITKAEVLRRILDQYINREEKEK